VLTNREMDPARRDQRLTRIPTPRTQLPHPPEEEADASLSASRAATSHNDIAGSLGGFLGD